MKIKFNKQMTVDLINRDYNTDPYDSDITFQQNQIVECEGLEESARGFVDILLEDGNVAVGIPKQNLIIL